MVAPMNTKFKLSHKQAQTRRDGEIYSQNHAHQVPEREGLDPDKGQLIVIHNLYGRVLSPCLLFLEPRDMLVIRPSKRLQYLLFRMRYLALACYRTLFRNGGYAAVCSAAKPSYQICGGVSGKSSIEHVMHPFLKISAPLVTVAPHRCGQ